MNVVGVQLNPYKPDFLVKCGTLPLQNRRQHLARPLNLWGFNTKIFVIVRDFKRSCRLRGITLSSLTDNFQLVEQRIGLTGAQARLEHSTSRNASTGEKCQVF